VGIFNWYYLSSPPQVLRSSVVGLEAGGLALHRATITKQAAVLPGGQVHCAWRWQQLHYTVAAGQYTDAKYYGSGSALPGTGTVVFGWKTLA
jgi:hypothetical protein